jgi:hypothetical protein
MDEHGDRSEHLRSVLLMLDDNLHGSVHHRRRGVTEVGSGAGSLRGTSWVHGDFNHAVDRAVAGGTALPMTGAAGDVNGSSAVGSVASADATQGGGALDGTIVLWETTGSGERDEVVARSILDAWEVFIMQHRRLQGGTEIEQGGEVMQGGVGPGSQRQGVGDDGGDSNSKSDKECEGDFEDVPSAPLMVPAQTPVCEDVPSAPLMVPAQTPVCEDVPSAPLMVPAQTPVNDDVSSIDLQHSAVAEYACGCDDAWDEQEHHEAMCAEAQQHDQQPIPVTLIVYVYWTAGLGGNDGSSSSSSNGSSNGEGSGHDNSISSWNIRTVEYALSQSSLDGSYEMGDWQVVSSALFVCIARSSVLVCMIL